MTGFYRRANSSGGFTLIELIVVLFILGLLAGLVGPRILGRVDEAKVTETITQLRTIETALKLYRLDNGFYPTTDQGLEALVSKPTAGQVPERYRTGGYLDVKRVPRDAWDNAFVYASPGLNGDYDLISYGRDGNPGGEGTDADIESWNLD